MTSWSKSLPWLALLAVVAACGNKPGELRRIKGTIEGLTGTGLVLQLNGGHGLTVAAKATAFDFTDNGTWMVEGANYSVTVDANSSITDPVQHCWVLNGSGTVRSADIDDIVVSCIDAASDANLSSLVLSEGTLVPPFSVGTTAYSAEVAFSVSEVTVTPTAEDGGATITVQHIPVQSGSASSSIALEVGSSTITVIVTAEDRLSTKTYTVIVKRQEVNAGTWVEIQPGTFTMGSPANEVGRDATEVQHQVTLKRGFVMLSTEVTQAEFNRRMGYNPSRFQPPTYPDCPTCPVEMVSWHESAAYCNALSTAAGKESCYACDGTLPNVTCTPSTAYSTPYDCPGYRLPTEAEWEYAARAGTTTATYNGDLDSGHLNCEEQNNVLDPIAWFCGNSNSTTHEVGKKGANEWHLYDMLGNVVAWCHDWYGSYEGNATNPSGPSTGSNRVFRGGSWGGFAVGARAANRGFGDPGGRSSYLGLRPVRSLL